MLPSFFAYIELKNKTACSKKPRPSEKDGVGAGNVTRTRDLLITNQLLYQLSYTSNDPTTMGRKYYNCKF